MRPFLDLFPVYKNLDLCNFSNSSTGRGGTIAMFEAILLGSSRSIVSLWLTGPGTLRLFKNILTSKCGT